jgi:plastocyanin
MSVRTLRTLRTKSLAVALVTLLIGAASIALVMTAPARAESSIATDASSALSVTAVAGFAFTPNSIQMLPTNTNISITFTDADTIDHTFTIIGKQGWVIPSDYSGGQIDSLAYGSSPRALFSVNSSADSQAPVGSFTSPGVGWYEFICTEPGHFQNGMYGFIAFGMNLPGNLSVSAANTDPGPAVFIIVGTIVALTVIALVLGFVVGRRRGATYEMPPERLGYPEPEPPVSNPPSSPDPPIPPPNG